jgi:hypothetical protein
VWNLMPRGYSTVQLRRTITPISGFGSVVIIGRI